MSRPLRTGMARDAQRTRLADIGFQQGLHGGSNSARLILPDARGRLVPLAREVATRRPAS
jgi:hypothetical protein